MTSVLQCVAVCCSVLQRIAVCCSVLQRVGVDCHAQGIIVMATAVGRVWRGVCADHAEAAKGRC